MLRNLLRTAALGAAVLVFMVPADADQEQNQPVKQAEPARTSPDRTARGMQAMGLVIPPMRSERGRKLFASKGCVICHSVNGIGGQHTPALDAENMALPMNPFDFAARMWRGAEAMIALQRNDLGNLIQLSGQELADIIAFVHDAEEQKKFSEADVPQRILDVMSEVHGDNNEN